MTMTADTYPTTDTQPAQMRDTMSVSVQVLSTVLLVAFASQSQLSPSTCSGPQVGHRADPCMARRFRPNWRAIYTATQHRRGDKIPHASSGKQRGA
jgi:hypothetical protein